MNTKCNRYIIFLSLFRQKREIHQDCLFMPHHQASKPPSTMRTPKRILIEGEAGVGKSTYCQKLSLAWSEQKCGTQCYCLYSPCIHSFDLLVYLRAADFKRFSSVSKAVHSNLFPQDSPVALEVVDELLRTKKTLFLVDGYCNGLMPL